MKIITAILSFLSCCVAYAGATITDVTAHQRYPWNGLVDISVMLSGEQTDVSKMVCTFAATNVATGAAVPIASVSLNGSDIGSGTTWMRRFIWNATNDVSEAKIDDLALAVSAEILLGVQLWENGPYWAECNVGATKPEEDGYYFWWGDAIGYMREGGTSTDNQHYSGVTWVSSTGARMSSSPFTSSACPTHDKGNPQLQSAGYIDLTGNLVAAHDAATVHLGAPWRLPTDAEMSTLLSRCDTSWTTRGGVSGRLVTGRGAYASKSIFLPAAGYGNGYFLNDLGSHGNYWSSAPDSGNSYDAWYACFYSSEIYRRTHSRYIGRSVRPVRGFTSVIVGGSILTHLALDTRSGTRTAAATETILFSPAWETTAEDAVATVRVNGAAVTNASEAGAFDWRPTQDGSYELSHVVSVNGMPVGETLNATFSVVGVSSPVPPVIKPASGTTFDTSLTVSMTCASEGATIHFTTNGTVPTMESSAYSRKFKIYGKTMVKAIALWEDGTASEMVVAEYAKGHCSMPVIAAQTEFMGSKQRVDIACATEGVTLYYTTDGQDPDSHSPKYTKPFYVTDTTTVKAYATKADYFDSAIATLAIAKVWGIGDTMGKPDHVFATSGAKGFVRVEDATATLGESMRSGAIADEEKSILSTKVIGPGTLTFKWKASCEEDDEYEWDHGEFRVNGGAPKRQINGVTDWIEVSQRIDGKGTNTVTWTYVKDDVESVDQDCIWVSDYVWASDYTTTQTTEVPVPYDWLRQKSRDIVDEYENYEKVAKQTAYNPRFTVEQCYVAGLDPESTTNEFTATIGTDLSIGWNPDLKAARDYKVWGSTNLVNGGDWEYPTNALHRFFKVTVEMPK